MTATNRQSWQSELDRAGAEALDRNAYRPVYALLIAYLALTGLLALFFVQPRVSGMAAAAVHGLTIGVLMWLSRSETSSRRLRMLRQVMPLLLVVPLYEELKLLNGILASQPRYDALVQQWEQALFGGRPAQTFHEVAPWAGVSEAVHLGYLSYYWIVPSVAVALLAQGRFRAMQRTLFTVLATFFFCYFIYMVFPVDGPWYVHPVPAPEELGGWAVYPAQWLLHRGSAPGTAFPSSHVAVSVAVLLMGLRYTPRLGAVLLPVVVALMLGTVYGGIHYAVDGVAGLAVGLTLGTAGPRLHALSESLRGSEGGRPRTAAPEEPTSYRAD